MSTNKYFLFLIIIYSSCNSVYDPIVTYGLSNKSIFHDGVDREYILYIPESYEDGTEVPVMLNFHGFGGSAFRHLNNADMRDLSERENFILVYPEGTLLDGFQHWNPGINSSWNKSSADDYGFIDKLIKSLGDTYNIDLNRVYACGYSNGGFFSYGLACHFSDKIAAVGSVAGTMLSGTYNSCQASFPKATINIHGTSDYVVPYNGTYGYTPIEDVIRFWADLNNCNNVEINYESNVENHVYFDDNEYSYVNHYKIIGGLHVWDDDLNFNGKNTSELIWEFVSKYDINGLR